MSWRSRDLSTRIRRNAVGGAPVGFKITGPAVVANSGGGVQLRRDPTVYLVTRGEYSDYRVVGVFTSRENAEQFMVAIPPNGGYGNDYDNAITCEGGYCSD